jgi:hypothetical protein
MLWYSPVLFGKEWIKLQGKKPEDIAGPTKITYLVAPISAFVSTWIIALLLTIMQCEINIGSALTVSMLVGLFASAKIAMNHLFEFRPFKYYLITVGYHLVSCAITGVVLGYGRINFF